MTETDPAFLRLTPIQENYNLSKLSFGDPNYTPLKIFLKKAALSFHNHNVAKTYTLVDSAESPRVWGYITLMNSEIILNENQRPQEIHASSRYEAFPAVKIARLAIDKALQGHGYGRFILEWAITLVKDKVAPNVGCRFLVVDAKQASIAFYQRLGFELFNLKTADSEEHPLMFLDLFRKNLP